MARTVNLKWKRMRGDLCAVTLTGTSMPNYLEQFCWLCEDIMRAEGYKSQIPREWIESRWCEMSASVSNGTTVVILAFIGKGVSGVLEFSVEKPLTMLSGVRIKRLLLDPNFNQEKITRALMQSASLHAMTVGEPPEVLALNPRPRPRLNCRDLPLEAAPVPVYRPHRIWYPVESPELALDNTVFVVPCYDLPLSVDFYCDKLGMSVFAFRHLGVFANAGAAILLLDQVEAFHRDPDPILECRVLDLFATLEDLTDRNVYIIPRGKKYLGEQEIVTEEDGSLGALIRDPDGNLLALRQETMKSKLRENHPSKLYWLKPSGE